MATFLLMKTTFSQTVNFSFNGDSAFVGMPLTFTNSSTGFPASTKFIWNFGDPCRIQQGASPGMSYLRNDSICNDTTLGIIPILHTFYMPVKFTVTLKATYNNSSYQKQIDVVLQQVVGCPTTQCNIIGNGGFNNNAKCVQAFAARHGISTNQINNYSLSVYPNPASNFVTFGYVLPINEKATVSIYDGLGRMVKTLELIGSENFTELQINIAEIPSGI